MPDSTTINSISSIVIVVGAIVGGAWGLYTYAQNGRLAKAKWMNDVVQRFLFDEGMVSRRKLVEDHYVARVSDTLDRWLQGYYPRDAYDDAEVDTWKALDAVLSHYEFLLHLERQGYLNRADRDVLLTWWLESLREPRYANLRLYLARWQYRHVASTLGFVDQEYLWLDQPQRDQIPPGAWQAIEVQLRAVGPNVWAVTSPRVFLTLDPIFDYQPGFASGSAIARRCRLTTEPRDLPAWRYEARERPSSSVAVH